MRGPAALVARPETADMDDQASNGSTTDRDLVERAAAGDAAAFSELYERHFENLYDFAARTVRDRDLAADALQGAFIKAWKRLPSGDAVEHPQPWLYALVRAEAMGAARDETGTSPAGSGPGEADPGLFAATDTASDTGAAEPPPDAALAALAWQAASALDADDYSLLDLSLRRGLDGRAIARALELEESDVYARLTRLGSSFEGAATSLALAVRGREACPELDGLVVARKDGSRVELDRPANRRIRAHLKTCLTCQETRRLLLAPTESFAALAPVAAMPGVREAVWSGLDVQAEAATSGDSGERIAEGEPAEPVGDESGAPVPAEDQDGGTDDADATDDPPGPEDEAPQPRVRRRLATTVGAFAVAGAAVVAVLVAAGGTGEDPITTPAPALAGEADASMTEGADEPDASAAVDPTDSTAASVEDSMATSGDDPTEPAPPEPPPPSGPPGAAGPPEAPDPPDAQDPIPLEEWIVAADIACVDGRRQTEELGPAKNMKRLAKVAPKAREIGEDVRARIATLPPPDDEQSTVVELLAFVDEELALLDPIAEAAEERDTEQVAALREASTVLQSSQAELAQEIGLELCYQPEVELSTQPETPPAAPTETTPASTETTAAATGSTPAPAQPALAKPNVELTYIHHATFSEVCIAVTTDPPQPGAVYSTTIRPTGDTSQAELDVAGTASASENITSHRSYTVAVKVEGADGKTRKTKAAIDVTADDGSCAPG